MRGAQDNTTATLNPPRKVCTSFRDINVRTDWNVMRYSAGTHKPHMADEAKVVHNAQVTHSGGVLVCG